MNYNWRIVRLGLSDELNHNSDLLENAVMNVRWKLVATDEQNQTSSYVGSTNLSVYQTSLEDFITLDNITESTVLSWVQNSIPEERINNIKNILSKKLEVQKQRVYKPNW